MLAFHKPFLDPISTMAPTFLDRSVKHKTIAEQDRASCNTYSNV